MYDMEEEKYSSPKPGKKIGFLSRSNFDDDDTRTGTGDNMEEEISPLPSLSLRSKLFSNDSISVEGDFNSSTFSESRNDSKSILHLKTEMNTQHPEVNTISAESVNELLKYGYRGQNVLIIDCRFPYEFDAGHIQGAINIYLPKQLQSLLFEWAELLCYDSFLTFLKEYGGMPSKAHIRSKFKRGVEKATEPIIIFHCEFSQSRSPRMWKHIRSHDRTINQYPSLTYNNIYLLSEGYCAFHKDYSSLCDGEYMSMFDKKFRMERREYEDEVKENFNSNQKKMLGVRRSITTF